MSHHGHSIGGEELGRGEDGEVGKVGQQVDDRHLGHHHQVDDHYHHHHHQIDYHHHHHHQQDQNIINICSFSQSLL